MDRAGRALRKTSLEGTRKRLLCFSYLRQQKLGHKKLVARIYIAVYQYFHLFIG